MARPAKRFRDPRDVAALVDAFHAVHEQVFAVRDEESQVECLNWKARLRIGLARPVAVPDALPEGTAGPARARRPAYFGGGARIETPIYPGAALAKGAVLRGPAIIEEPTTTIVVYPGMTARLSAADNFILEVA